MFPRSRTTFPSKTKVLETFPTLSRLVEQVWLTFPEFPGYIENIWVLLLRQFTGWAFQQRKCRLDKRNPNLKWSEVSGTKSRNYERDSEMCGLETKLARFSSYLVCVSFMGVKNVWRRLSSKFLIFFDFWWFLYRGLVFSLPVSRFEKLHFRWKVKWKFKILK